MPDRYSQLLDLIDKHKPRTIIEIGIHRAYRAEAMIERALRYNACIHYAGFDVFETMDAKFHADAMNGKGIPNEAAARARLNALSAKHPDFTYSFVIGDTRQTLHGKRYAADFVFIDGDHRVDTIRGDYAAVAGSECIVFDDFLIPGPHGEIPDIALFGANIIIDEIAREEAFSIAHLPIRDRCKHGGYAALVSVVRKGR